MGTDVHDLELLPPDDFEGDPLLASFVQDVDQSHREDGLSITLTVGGMLVSGKLGSRAAYNRDCLRHLAQGDERDRAGVGQAFLDKVPLDVKNDAATTALLPVYIHVKDVRFFDATGASVPRGPHWPSVWWRGRIAAVDGWTLGELRIDQGELE
jgi:hypothetical protein